MKFSFLNNPSSVIFQMWRNRKQKKAGKNELGSVDQKKNILGLKEEMGI